MLICRPDWQELMDAHHPMYDLVAPLLPRCLPLGAADHFVVCSSHALDDIDIIAYHLLLEAPLAVDNAELHHRYRQLMRRYRPESLMDVDLVNGFLNGKLQLFICAGRRL